MTTEQKLREIFALSLQLPDCTFMYDPGSESVHLYSFIRYPNKRSEYDINIESYLADWVPKKDPKHIDQAIKRTKELINLKNNYDKTRNDI